ncbi:hypothetical protein EVI01_14840 [Enterococcus villorum]|uniref:Uncharacterized protein n=1 Tax=Enterococcus villorum TaxID=112904 RepID=A0A511J2A7_9ENTE|nr:hypothetical protein EVI01_14840 [Enterococcus villorum]
MNNNKNPISPEKKGPDKEIIIWTFGVIFFKVTKDIRQGLTSKK